MEFVPFKAAVAAGVATIMTAHVLVPALDEHRPATLSKRIITGILRQELPGPLNDEQKKQLGMVQSSARHLLGLINDLLDLSRIESGRMELYVEEFAVADLVNETEIARDRHGDAMRAVADGTTHGTRMGAAPDRVLAWALGPHRR